MIGMVKVLRDDLKADDPPDPPDAYGIGYTTLAWSRDGEHWTRDPEPFFDRDPQPGAWDHAHARIDEQVPVGDEVFMYYGGYARGHKVEPTKERQIGLAKMPLDRFVALESSGPGVGTIRTISLRIPPQADADLVLNADASRGRLRVQVRSAENGAVIPGFAFAQCTAITADGLKLPVRWRAEEHLPKDKAIQLEFELLDAKLFAFDLARN